MDVSRATEIERKYTVPEGVAVPTLDAVDGVTDTAPQPVAALDAVYFDTADRVLLNARIALRRRLGGHDAGWHVKLRAAQGRTELHAPLDPADPDALPAAFEAALRSRLRGRPVEPIARIRTERHPVIVRGPGGGEVEVVDDRVRATDVASGVDRTWREWEAELTGDPDASAVLLERVDAALVAAGARASSSPAKLAQALGQDGPAPVRKRPKRAGALLDAAIAEQAETLHGLLMTLALDGDPEGEVVHGLRKTIRRLTSLTALDAVAGPSGARLRERLRRLGHDLGHARDPLVAAGLAAELLHGVPVDLPGRETAVAALVAGPRQLAGARTVAAAAELGGPGALDTYAALDGFTADGPDAGKEPRVLRRLARRTVRRAVKRARRAGRDLDALHSARRAAKRARMVVEACVDLGVVPPKSALAKQAAAAKAVQEDLGDHRDLELLRESLPAAADAVARAGGNAYAIGYLALLVEQRAAGRLTRARRAIRRLG